MSSDYGSDVFSDYGSDFLSDDIDAIHDAQQTAVAVCVSAATPQGAPKPRNVNLPATPPPSQSQREKEIYSITPGSRMREPFHQKRQEKQRHTSMISPVPPVAPLNRYSTPRQKTPSLSQQLPTPSTTGLLLSSYPVLPSSQSTPLRRLTGPPLYRFPFGTHRGKTLLEVPENYITYLRVDQNMSDSMPGFSDVLSLFDAGQPPIALPPPPSSSQSALCRVSSSPTPIAVPPSQRTIMKGPCSPAPVKAPQPQYRFDFGIHAGKTLDEVPSDYLNFLKQRGIVEGKPTLAAAVAKYELEHPSSTQASSSQSDPARFTLSFGKHIGKTLKEVPHDYLAWLKSSKIFIENQAVHDAIVYFERTQNLVQPKTPLKRKRVPQVTLYGYPSSSVKRRYAPKKIMRIW